MPLVYDHFSQRTREMGHPFFVLLIFGSEKWGALENRRNVIRTFQCTSRVVPTLSQRA
jgi:hypothetical protein